MTLITLLPKHELPQRTRQFNLIQNTIAFFKDNFPSPKALLLGGLPCLLWAFACLYFAGSLKQEHGVRTGYTRKIFHFLIFGTVSVLHSTLGTSAVCLFGGMTTVIIFYAVFKGPGNLLYEAMAREKDEPHCRYYIIAPYFATLAGGLVSNILFGEAAIFGYLITGLGDAVGEPVGARFGKHQYRVPAFGGIKAVRSYEGSAAVFIMCLLAIILGVAMSPLLEFTSIMFFLVPLLAFVCMIVEAISPHGWDNAVLQIIPSLLVILVFGGISV